MSNIESNVYNTPAAFACVETDDGRNALPNTGFSGTQYSPAFSTRGHFGDRTVSVGSPVPPMLQDRRWSGLSQAIRSASRAQDDPSFRDAPHWQPGRRRAFSETIAARADAESFHSAQHSARAIAARYHRYGAALNKPHPAGRELAPLARILDYLSPLRTLTPQTPATRAIHEAAALMGDILSGDASRDAAALEERVARIEDALTTAECSRHVRSNDGFRQLFPADHEAPRDADAVERMSQAILIDCANAQSVLRSWLHLIESGDVATFRRDRISVSAPHGRIPGRSEPIPIPSPAAQESMAVHGGLVTLGEDMAFISRFATGRKEDLAIDGESLLLAVAAQVADHARKLRLDHFSV